MKFDVSTSSNCQLLDKSKAIDMPILVTQGKMFEGPSSQFEKSKISSSGNRIHQETDQTFETSLFKNIRAGANFGELPEIKQRED